MTTRDRMPHPVRSTTIYGQRYFDQKINTEILSYQAAKVGHYGQGSPPANSALEDQRLEVFSAIKKFAFADKGGVLPQDRMIFPLDFFLVLCPLFINILPVPFILYSFYCFWGVAKKSRSDFYGCRTIAIQAVGKAGNRAPPRGLQKITAMGLGP